LIVKVAIKSVELERKITTRVLADILSASHTASYFNHYPIYVEFYYFISDNIASVRRKTLKNLGK